MLGHWDRHGVGLFSVIRKDDEQFVGRVGYLLWDTERWENGISEVLEGDLELEIGWTILRAFWNQGYATEAAIACRDHAFDELGRDRVISLDRAGERCFDPSRREARRVVRARRRAREAGSVGVYALGNRPAR